MYDISILILLLTEKWSFDPTLGNEINLQVSRYTQHQKALCNVPSYLPPNEECGRVIVMRRILFSTFARMALVLVRATFAGSWELWCALCPLAKIPLFSRQWLILQKVCTFFKWKHLPGLRNSTRFCTEGKTMRLWSIFVCFCLVSGTISSLVALSLVGTKREHWDLQVERKFFLASLERRKLVKNFTHVTWVTS